MTGTRVRMEEAQEELLVSKHHLHFIESTYFISAKSGTTSVYIPLDLARHLKLHNGDDVVLVLAKKSDWKRVEDESVKLDLARG